jgi:hypothetical protein
MKPLRILVLLVITIFICTNLTQAQTKLDKKISTIIVTYGYVGCTCAQWVINDKRLKSTDAEYIYLEPANNKLIDADKLPDGLHIIKVKVMGHFYTEKGYPKNFIAGKGNPKSARVFRYDKVQNLKVKNKSS